jgi:hypothetical protein
MTEFPYSRLLNRPVRYGKYFTMIDLFIIVVGLLVVTPLMGLGAFLAGFVFYFLHLLFFRLGKRPGYDVHFFKSYIRAER